MRVTLTKTSHDTHHMNGKAFESRSFLPHDLMHFVFAKVTGSENGFFSGKKDEMREEQIVGILQGVYKEYASDPENFELENAITRINEMLAYSERAPLTTNESDLIRVFSEFATLRDRWKFMKTGETLIVEI